MSSELRPICNTDASSGDGGCRKKTLTDAEIELTVYKSSNDNPEHLRIVRFYDEEQYREFMFLTNAMDLTAQQIANLYRNRWQIELFFKWLKQNLKIK